MRGLAEEPAWWQLRQRMLWRPKPPIAGRVERRSRGVLDWRADVLHDGRDRWRIDDGRRLEVTDGRTAVLVDRERGRVEAFDADGLRAHVEVKTLVHPEYLARITDHAARVTGPCVEASRHCWQVIVPGLLAHEPDVAYLLAVDAETGVVLAQCRDAPDFAAVRFVAVSMDRSVQLDPATFSWSGRTDRDLRSGTSA